MWLVHDRYGCVLIHAGSIQATNISAIAVLMSQPENVQAFRKAVGDYSTGEGRENNAIHVTLCQDTSLRALQDNRGLLQGIRLQRTRDGR